MADRIESDEQDKHLQHYGKILAQQDAINRRRIQDVIDFDVEIANLQAEDEAGR